MLESKEISQVTLWRTFYWLKKKKKKTEFYSVDNFSGLKYKYIYIYEFLMIPEKHSFIISTIYKLKGNVNHVSSLLLQAVPQGSNS